MSKYNDDDDDKWATFPSKTRHLCRFVPHLKSHSPAAPGEIWN